MARQTCVKHNKNSLVRSLISIFFIVLCINSFAAVQANFNSDKTAGCPPLLVNFTNTSLPANATWYWDFGNGNTSSLQNPSAVFNNAGTYQVKLVVRSGNQTDSISKTITVYRPASVDFHAPQTQSCPGVELQFISDAAAGDAPIVDYAWGFGNGVASSLMNTSHTYSQGGVYDITLVVQDANGCTSNKTKNSYIRILPAPTASFIATPPYSCNASQLISFTNTSTGNGLSYLWVLDDSVTSVLPNPSHTYIQEKKEVVLAVTDVNGCVGTYKQFVSATDVIADFTVTKTTACTGEMIQFVNNSNIIGRADWFFGDGTASYNILNPNKVYTTPGVYTVKLINTYNGCSDTIVKIDYITIIEGTSPSISVDMPPPAGCESTAVVNFTNSTPGTSQILWMFGDGGTSADQNPSHTFNSNGVYQVIVTITDSMGCTSRITVTTQVNSIAPVPAFTNEAVSCPQVPVKFTNLTPGQAASYYWNFGDGQTSGDKSPLHTYSQPGTYSVSLTVTNPNGCDSTITKVNCITIDNVTADFSVNRTFSPCPPFVTIFTSWANKPELDYLWDFGDGTTDTAANPTHIYFHPGIFTVKLFVTSPIGCTDTVIYPDLIEVQGPTGLFSAVPSSGCVPLNVTFQSAISDNTEKIWCDLGDGTVVEDTLHFVHTYNTVNTFYPRYILVDHVGCTVPYDLPPIVTHELPVLLLSDTTVCDGETISVLLGTEKYKWTPSTYLSCDTCSDVTIVPQSNITYKVTATNEHGCRLTDTMRVTSMDYPTLNQTSQVKVCKGAPVQLFVGDAHSYNWSPALYLSDSATARPVCTPQGSITYHVKASNSLGCSTNAQVTVDVLDKIDIGITSDTTVCIGDEFHLRTAIINAPDSEVHYRWTPTSFGDNPNPLITGLTRTTTFTVIAESSTCKADTESVTVRIVNLPDMNVSDAVTTTPGAEIQVWAQSRQNLSYLWSADSVSCTDCRVTNIYPSKSQFVYVTGTNSNGCKTTDSINIHVVPCDPESIFLANTFTPNADGLNDRFVLHSKALNSLSYFRVFDKWGQMIFETKDLNESWDGTVNGKPAPVGVYVYLLGGECQNGFTVTKSDDITLIR